MSNRTRLFLKKKLSCATSLLVLTVLVLTAHTSFGQQKPMSISQVNISKSIKCFEEAKTLRLLTAAKDTQLTAANNIIADYKMLADTLQKDIKTKDQELQQQAKLLKRQKAFLTIAKYAIAIEAIYIISNKIF